MVFEILELCEQQIEVILIILQMNIYPSFLSIDSVVAERGYGFYV